MFLIFTFLRHISKIEKRDINTYTHVRTYTHTYIHAHTHTYKHTYTHTHTHTYIHTHTHIHTYTHTYIHTCMHYFVQESINEGQYVVVIRLDVKGAFDAAWWPGILTYLKNLRCPRNLHKVRVSYFNERAAYVTLNNGTVQRKVSKVCPQGSASGPGFWNLQYNSLLNLEYTKNTKVIAYADDLMIIVKGTTQVEVENYANMETQKVAKWARNNKVNFNDQKLKIMVITRNKPKNRRDFNIFLNNKNLKQEDTIKYLGIIIDRRFNFNEHIDNIAGKCIKIIHALSKSSKIKWRQRHDVLRIIYAGAILPILSHGAPIWIEMLEPKT